MSALTCFSLLASYRCKEGLSPQSGSRGGGEACPSSAGSSSHSTLCSINILKYRAPLPIILTEKTGGVTVGKQKCTRLVHPKTI